jgi:type VI secretion system protein ImpK
VPGYRRSGGSRRAGGTAVGPPEPEHAAGARGPRTAREVAAPPGEPRLRHLCTDLFALAIRLRQANPLPDAASLGRTVTERLTAFEARARDAGIHATSIEQAKYAVCALLDETILNSAAPGGAKDAWLTEPLQMRYFGENTAGEGFYTRLEALRRTPGAQSVLEVYSVCLALGFEGRHRLSAAGELAALRTALSVEVSPRRPPPLGPHAARPDAPDIATRRFPYELCALALVFVIALAIVLAGQHAASNATSVSQRLREAAGEPVDPTR